MHYSSNNLPVRCDDLAQLNTIYTVPRVIDDGVYHPLLHASRDRYATIQARISERLQEVLRHVLLYARLGLGCAYIDIQYTRTVAGYAYDGSRLPRTSCVYRALQRSTPVHHSILLEMRP